MKILILVLSYNVSPFKELMQAQQETFDSVEVDGVKTVYYHGGAHPQGELLKFAIKYSNPNSTWERVEFDCTDAYYLMAAKFKMALEYVKDWDYDIIFRTNSSSYINKKRLKEFAETLPTEKLYAGWEIQGNAGYNVCSGAGFFLSRDTAEILRNSIDPTFEREEDVYCAQLLHEAGIKIINDKSRVDVPLIINKNIIPVDKYHYRFKTTQNRLADIGNMKTLHTLILKNESGI